MIARDVLEVAVRRFAGADAVLVSARPLAGDRGGTELKQAGYGEPLHLRYRAGGEEREAVFRTMTPSWFGHDRRSDRALLALLAEDTYADMPRHVRVLDVGFLEAASPDKGAAAGLTSIHGAGEAYLITSYAEGALYARDLRAIEARRSATQLDAARAHALCHYLVELHTAPHPGAPELYTRAIRDLVGSGEGVFGIADSYPPDGPIPAARICAIERLCLEWRHRLRGLEHRLRRTHGDYHPYNVLFREGVDFTMLDTSRGGVGEPADDVVAMTINYFFGGVVVEGAWAQGMKPLWDAFWRVYLSATNDEEILTVAAPFIAWRALVLASPVWYPGIAPEAREAILGLAEAALEAPSFDPAMAERFVR